MNDMSTAVIRQLAKIDRDYRATEFPAMREFLIEQAERERAFEADRIAPRALGGR